MKCHRFTLCPNMFNPQRMVPSVAAWWRASVLGAALWLRDGPLGGSCCLSTLTRAHSVLPSVACVAGQGKQDVHCAGVVETSAHSCVSSGAPMARPTDSPSGRFR